MRKMLTLASLLSFATLGPALAETVRIPYTQADLANETATAALYDKVTETAKSVCKNGFERSRVLINEQAVLRECVSETIADALRSAREPALTGYHKTVIAAQKAGPASASLAMR